MAIIKAGGVSMGSSGGYVTSVNGKLGDVLTHIENMNTTGGNPGSNYYIFVRDTTTLAQTLNLTGANVTSPGFTFRAIDVVGNRTLTLAAAPSRTNTRFKSAKGTFIGSYVSEYPPTDSYVSLWCAYLGQSDDDYYEYFVEETTSYKNRSYAKYTLTTWSNRVLNISAEQWSSACDITFTYNEGTQLNTDGSIVIDSNATPLLIGAKYRVLTTQPNYTSGGFISLIFNGPATIKWYGGESSETSGSKYTPTKPGGIDVELTFIRNLSGVPEYYLVDNNR